MIKLFALSLLVPMLAFGFGVYKSQADRIASLEKQLAALEIKTAPITQTFDNLCSGKEDDFYEGFYRLLMEKCEKK